METWPRLKEVEKSERIATESKRKSPWDHQWNWPLDSTKMTIGRNKSDLIKFHVRRHEEKLEK